MPKAPTYLDKVNYIVDFVIDPCNAPLVVYLELAHAPLGNAVLTWLTFGLADVLRGYARPSKALGGRPSSRRGKGKPRPSRLGRAVAHTAGRARRIPGLGDDTGGALGKLLPGAKDFKGRHVQDLEKNLWFLDDVGQRVLLALLIIDIGIDFAYEWFTLLDMSEFCQRDSVGSLYARGPGTSAGVIFICNTGNAPEVVFSDGNVGWQTAVGSVGPRGWNAACSLVVKNTSAFHVDHFQSALISDSLGTRTFATETRSIPPGAEDTSIMYLQIIGPGSFVIRHCAFGGLVVPVGEFAQNIYIWGGGTR